MGFTDCAIIPFPDFSEYKDSLEKRSKEFPASKELYDTLYPMAGKIENAKSLIVSSQRYNSYKINSALEGRIGKMYLYDSRLNYSAEFRARQEFEVYLKTLGLNLLQAAVPARWAALKAGIGKFGRNNFIYDDVHGSYITILSWVIDSVLDYDSVAAGAAPAAVSVSDAGAAPAGEAFPAPADPRIAEGCSEACLKCVAACPTKALSEAFSMNRAKCIAELSFFSNEKPDELTQSQMGQWIYGCDVCQDVCPLNKDKFTETEEFPLLTEFEKYLETESILNMDQETYENVLNPRFWYMGKDKLWLWKNNAERVLKNSKAGKS